MTGVQTCALPIYGHSIAGLKNRDEFHRQVQLHMQKTEELFGLRPTSFRNTELIYSDEIGEWVAAMGLQSMLAEGAKHVLGWRSPNYLYYNANNPKLSVLLRNFRMSDDIGFRFSNKSWPEWPLTTDKYINWLNTFDEKQQLVNVFLDYETFGEHQWKETGIFDFLAELPEAVFSSSNYQFHTPSQIASLYQPVAPIHVPYPSSWADEERDVTAWLGNELQEEAASSLYGLTQKVYHCDDPSIWSDWMYLQTSDHFYYMCTKWFSDGEVHKYFNPYPSPYEAYINYMNVLSDFVIRVNQNSAGKETYKGWPSVSSVLEFESVPRAMAQISAGKPGKKPKKPASAPDWNVFLNKVRNASRSRLKNALKMCSNETLALLHGLVNEEWNSIVSDLIPHKRIKELENLRKKFRKPAKSSITQAFSEFIDMITSR